MSQHEADVTPGGYTEVERLFADRGSVTKVAGELRCSVQTVYSWKRSGSIPPWRRPAVLDAVRRLQMAVEPQVLAYLNRVA